MEFGSRTKLGIATGISHTGRLRVAAHEVPLAKGQLPTGNGAGEATRRDPG
jgi:hypothetical protein